MPVASGANQLYLKWIEEERDKHKRRDQKGWLAWQAAAKSIRQYPHPLNTPEEAMKLDRIGRTIVAYLKTRSEELDGRSGLTPVAETSSAAARNNKRGRPSIEYNSETEYRPAKKRAKGTGATPPPLEKDDITFLFWYLDQTYNRVQSRAEGHIEMADEPGYRVEIGSNSAHDMLSVLRNIVHRDGRTIALLPLELADDYTASTLAARSKSLSVSRDPEASSSSALPMINPPHRVSGHSLAPRTDRNLVAAVDFDMMSLMQKMSPPQYLAPFEPIVVPAGAYDVVCILDNQEKLNTYIYEQLVAAGIPIELRTLTIGDVLWIAKRKPAYKTGTELDEIVLDIVVERKRLSDLCQSVANGRYHEQKFRLRQSGISRVFYVVEEDSGLGARDREMYGKTITTCISSTQVVDGFMVKETTGRPDTVRFYLTIHKVILSAVNNQNLYLIPPELVKRGTYLDRQKQLREREPHRSYLTTFARYQDLNHKSRHTTLKTAWAEMLLRVNGMSTELTAALIKKFPTPRSLYEFLVEAEEQESAMREYELKNPPQKQPGQRKARSQVPEARLALADIGNAYRHIGLKRSEDIYNLVRG